MGTPAGTANPLRRVGVALGVLAVAGAGFFAGSAIAGAVQSPDANGAQVAPGLATEPGGLPASWKNVDFPRNAAGQTYGLMEVVAFDEWPDLVEVVATNGRFGYVERDLLNETTGGHVSTPEEALKWQRQMDEATWISKEIPVFESDGTTEIGHFEITRSYSDPEREAAHAD